MLKKISVYIAIITVAFSFSFSNAKAFDWPEHNFDQNLNRAAVDTEIGRSFAPTYFDVGSSVYGTVSGDGIIFYPYKNSSNQTTIRAYDMAQQKIIWDKTTPQYAEKTVFSDHKLYYATQNTFYCIEAATGNEIWQYSYQQDINYPFYSTVYQVDDKYVYGFKRRYYSFNLYILDKNTGNLVFYDNNSIGDSIVNVATTDNKIFVNLDMTYGKYSTTYAYNKSDFSRIQTKDPCRDSHYMLLDQDNNTVIITSDRGAFCVYNMDDLSTIRMNSIRHFGLVKYGNNLYSSDEHYLYKINASNTQYEFSRTLVLSNPDSFNDEQIIVNGVLYAPTNTGKIWSKNLETGDTKITQITDYSYVFNISYTDGRLLALASNSAGYNERRLYILDINDLAAKPKYTINIQNPYQSTGMNQYLGQLHSHWIPDVVEWNIFANGIIYPDFTINEYDKLGYDFMALTEHNKVVEMPWVDESKIMQIKNAEEDTQGVKGNHILSIGIQSPVNETLSDQERIDQIVNQGGIPILAHPSAKDYSISLEELLKLKNYSTIEAFNGSINNWSILRLRTGSGSSFDKIDKLLSTGKNIKISASDDYTPGDGGIDGGAVVVLSPTNTQADIMANLKAGNFYAVQGSKAPRIQINFNDITNEITINSNELSKIKFIGKNGKELQKQENISQSTYKINGDEKYVRAEIKSEKTGLKSWTQPFIVDKKVDQTVAGGSKHVVTLEDIIIGTNSEQPTNIKVVTTNQLPNATPPAGHLGDVVSLQTEGGIGADTYISYSYRNINLPTNENSLCIYTYSEEYQKWLPVPSTVNPDAKTVITYLPHYSMYTLSATIPEDTTAPSLELISPTDLNSLSGNVKFEVKSNDNEATTSVNFGIDGNYLGYDIDGKDGWSLETNVDSISAGKHTLNITAEDYAGNVTKQEYVITVVNNIPTPSVTIDSPTSTDFLSGISTITGHFASGYKVANIDLFINNLHIKNAEIDDTTSIYSSQVNWSDYKDGKYELKAILQDINGNSAEVKQIINIGEQQTAIIVSPQSASYRWSDDMEIKIETNPKDLPIKIFLNNKEVQNNSKIRLAEYSKGSHRLEVKYNDTLLNSTNFNITISYDDVRIMMNKLQNEKHIYSNSIIINPFNFAEYLVKNNRLTNVNNYLNVVITLLKMQARLKIPFFDAYATSIIIRGAEGLKI